jgi:hypothetical protein
MPARINAAMLSVLLMVVGSGALAQDKANDFSGTWTWSYEGFGGNQVEITMKLKQEGEKLTGTVTGFGGEEMPLSDGKVKDGEMSVKSVREVGGQKWTTTYTGKLVGGSLKGKSETVISRDFDAKRS